jgi:hypothetical protein
LFAGRTDSGTDGGTDRRGDGATDARNGGTEYWLMGM